MPIIDKIQLSGTVYTIGSENSGVTSGEVQTMIDNSLSGYVTTDTEQTISGRKIFTYSSNSAKAIEFKQTSDSAKLGFAIKNSAATNNEVASFEFRPNTFTIDGVQHPLLYFGHYRNNNTANAGVPQTVIGFRQYDQLNAAAYHYVLPLPEKAKAPFSLTTSFKDFYMPLGIKVDNSTMVMSDSRGVIDISEYIGGSSITIDPSLNTGSTNPVANSAITTAINAKQDSSKLPTYIVADWNYNKSTHKVSVGKVLKSNGGAMNINHSVITINNQGIFDNTGVSNLNLVETSAITTSVTSSSTDAQVPSAKAVNDKLGGLSLVKLTQAEYDALTTKDSNVLYVIVG